MHCMRIIKQETLSDVTYITRPNPGSQTSGNSGISFYSGLTF